MIPVLTHVLAALVGALLAGGTVASLTVPGLRAADEALVGMRSENKRLRRRLLGLPEDPAQVAPYRVPPPPVRLVDATWPGPVDPPTLVPCAACGGDGCPACVEVA